VDVGDPHEHRRARGVGGLRGPRPRPLHRRAPCGRSRGRRPHAGGRLMYELKSVHKRYGLAKVALRKIDLAVRDREFLVIYGPAGAGKSTLLNILAGIAKPTSGDVLRNGVSILKVPPEKRDAAMAFENYALYSHLSV